MTDRNGNGQADLREFVKSIQTQQGVLGKELQLSWVGNFDNLRTHLVGHDDARSEPLGSVLSFRRVPGGIQARLHLTRIGYQMKAEAPDIESCLEILENNLELKNPVWEPDWNRQQRERQELDKAIKGS